MQNFFSNPSVVISVFGLLITCVQIFLGYRKQRLDATFRLIEMLQEKDAQTDRFEMKSLISKAKLNGGDFSNLLDEERARISRVALLYGLAGSLAKRKRIYLDILLDSYGYSIYLNYQRLAPYSEWRKTTRNSDKGSLWKDFEWIANRAEKYVGKIDRIMVRTTEQQETS